MLVTKPVTRFQSSQGNELSSEGDGVPSFTSFLDNSVLETRWQYSPSSSSSQATSRATDKELAFIKRYIILKQLSTSTCPWIFTDIQQEACWTLKPKGTCSMSWKEPGENDHEGGEAHPTVPVGMCPPGQWGTWVWSHQDQPDSQI